MSGFVFEEFKREDGVDFCEEYGGVRWKGEKVGCLVRLVNLGVGR